MVLKIVRRAGAPDATSELVELREPKMFCVLHHHEGRPWNVQSYLHHSGSHQDVDRPDRELFQDPSAFIDGCATVNHTDADRSSTVFVCSFACSPKEGRVVF